MEICPAINIIYDAKVSDVVIESIDGEISAKGIFGRRAKGIVSLDQEAVALVPCLLFFSLLTERGDLDDLATLEHDVGDTKTATYESAVAKNFLEPPGFGISGNVEIVDLTSQQKITNSTAAKIGKVSSPVKAIENLEHFRAHLLSGNRVLIAMNNSWLHKYGLYSAIDLSYILNFLWKIKVIDSEDFP
jgi:hypothetical protein